MIKVIAFDYAGVITPGPLTQWTKENLSKDDPKYKFYKNSSNKWDLGEMLQGEIFDVLSEVTGIPPLQIWDKIYLKPKLDLEVIGIIKNLKVNYKIYLFSNFIADFLRKLLEKDGITDLFDEVIISSDYGIKKPNPVFFNLLVDHAQVEKDEIFFTDDAQENVKEANTFGIKGYQFTTVEQLINDLKKEGVKI